MREDSDRDCCDCDCGCDSACNRSSSKSTEPQDGARVGSVPEVVDRGR